MKSIGIIGGGIIGLFSAYYLRKQGHQVSIIDRNDLTDGCSYGNAGMIVPSHIVPLAAPGMMAKGLKMLMDNSSPFYIKPRFSGNLLRWGYHFWRKSTHAHVQESIPLLRDISLISKALYQDLAQDPAFAFGWEERGLLMLFKNASATHEMAEEAQLANQAGIEAQLLNAQETQKLEPHTQLNVHGAVYYPGDAHVYPNILIKNLLAWLKNNNVALLTGQEVEKITTESSETMRVSTSVDSYIFDEIVIAGGAWTPQIGQQLGIDLPLQGGKGYSFMAEGLASRPQIPAIMLEARATATPMATAMRFAGTMEIAGTDLSINMKRVGGIHRAIAQYYPELNVPMPTVEQVWSGLRPCSPDGLPYIGKLPHNQKVTIASGHGMMGLSLAPATGKLVQEIVSNTKTSMKIEGFGVQRFG